MPPIRNLPRRVIDAPPKFRLDINLPKFNGDLLAWTEFWELYCSAVHHNKNYTSVEKFVYLRGHLTGEAAKSIQGLSTTEASYQIVIDVLKDRFGRDDFKREALIANLLQLPGVTNSNDLKSLRRLVDDFTVNVRSLEALNTPSSRYGEVLLPVMKEKIPEEWRLQWARIKIQDAGTSQTSEFESFMKYLHDEMRIREDASHVACTKVRSKNTETVPVTPHRSAVSILSSQRAKVQAKPPEPGWLCMACGQGQHGLSRCDRYHRMTVDVRWAVVKKAGLCKIPRKENCRKYPIIRKYHPPL